MSPIISMCISEWKQQKQIARIGRPPLTKDEIPPIFYRHYPAYVNGTLTITELARVCDMSRTTVYKYIEILK